MFRKSPPNGSPPAPETTSTPPQPIPKVEVDQGVRRDRQVEKLALKISDVDLSQPDAPRVLFDGTWRKLELYRTKATLSLSDFTFRGGWSADLYSYRKSDRNWYDTLKCTVSVGRKFGTPFFTVMDGGDRRESLQRPRYTIFQTKFFDTLIHIDHDFELHNRLDAEKRSSEHYYHGSPIALFNSGADAKKFLQEEVLCFSEGYGRMYKDELEKRGDRPQQYRFPEVSFSNAKYNEYSNDNAGGFYGSSIALPVDVLEGLRRALTDFREGLAVKMNVWLELYGLDPQDDYGTTDGYHAALTLIPATAQLSGKIASISAEWDNYAKPFHSISSDQPDL